MHRALKSEAALECFATESKDLVFLTLFSPICEMMMMVQLCNVDKSRPYMWKIEYSPSRLGEIQMLLPLIPEETSQDCEKGLRGKFSMLGIH